MKKRVISIILIASVLTIGKGILVHAEDFSNLNDMEQGIYKHLQNRDTSFSFKYTGDKEEFKNSISKEIVAAYKTDDYTERSWLEIKPKATATKDGITATIDVTYLTTKDQEDYVNKETKEIAAQIIKPGMSDYEKVKIINDYLVNRYEYDSSLSSNNAYTALISGKSICQGYSMTAYKILSYSGIENKIIVGSVDGVLHSWNYVKVGNEWYNLDITNNDSMRSNKYFLVDDSVLETSNYKWDKTSYQQK